MAKLRKKVKEMETEKNREEKSESDGKLLQVRLSRPTFKKLKTVAVDEETTLQALVEKLVKEYLEEEYDWEDEEEEEGE